MSAAAWGVSLGHLFHASARLPAAAGTRARSWVLELESSSATKFSRHLVVRLPGAAWASNAHVGTLVLGLLAGARERREADPRAAVLFVRKGEGEATLVDQAVYTRNRAFRLYLSSKHGKAEVLRATPRFRGASDATQHELLLESLICNVAGGWVGGRRVAWAAHEAM